MQKTAILVILVMFSLLAKSQDSTDYTLNNIKRHATHLEQSLPLINTNIQAGNQQAVVQQAENIKLYIDSMEEEMQYLPDEYYFHLSSLVSAYHTDIDEFEKLILNKDFQGKDKYLSKALTSVQQRQNALHKALHSAYKTASGQQSGMDIDSVSEVVEEETVPVVDEHSAANDATVVNGSEVILVETVAPNEITTSNNALLLDTIHQAQQQIEQWINGIHLAMKENSFNKMGVHANSISNASVKIRDFSLLLKTDQKESLFILATSLKNLSDTLRELTPKGIAAQEEMQACLDKIAIKYSTLSTGISLVQ
jgi:hypothetical protein